MTTSPKLLAELHAANYSDEFGPHAKAEFLLGFAAALASEEVETMRRVLTVVSEMYGTPANKRIMTNAVEGFEKLAKGEE